MTQELTQAYVKCQNKTSVYYMYVTEYRRTSQFKSSHWKFRKAL